MAVCRRTLATLVLIVSFYSALLGQEFETWATKDGGNGHQYAVIPRQVSWTFASQLATRQGGYLATVTSKEENDFILAISDDESLWNASPTRTVGPWLGGFQESDAREPDKDWKWVTGEEFTFAPWAIEQPDDFRGVEDYVQYVTVRNQPEGTWNDIRNEGGVATPSISYVVEREPPQRLSGETRLFVDNVKLKGAFGTDEEVTFQIQEAMNCRAEWVLRTPNIDPSAIRRDIYSLDCDALQTELTVGNVEIGLEFSTHLPNPLIDDRSDRNGEEQVPYLFFFDIASSPFGAMKSSGQHSITFSDDALVQSEPVVAESADGNFGVMADIRFDANWSPLLERPAGDTYGDGTVGFDDFLVLSRNFGNSGPETSWRDGDFTNDQIVGFLDFLILSENFGTVSVGGQILENVPEPNTGPMLMAIATFCALFRRKIADIAQA